MISSLLFPFVFIGKGVPGRLTRLLALLAAALFLGTRPELRAEAADSFNYVTDQNTITLTGYTGTGGAVSVPATLNGLPVTAIGASAFASNTGLTQITIPSGVTTIDWSAFLGCAGLTAIEVAHSNPNFSSAGGVLFNKSQTVVLKYPGGKAGSYTLSNSIAAIDWYAFYHCTGLTQVTLPNSLKTIEVGAFSGCTGLTQVTLPKSLTFIGIEAFLGCTRLTAIEVSKSNPNFSSAEGVLFDKRQTVLLQYPGGKAGTYTLPNSVTDIRQVAFRGCIGLTQVTFSNSLTAIGGNAFFGCTGLTHLRFMSNAPSIRRGVWDTGLFAGIGGGWTFPTVLYLPGTMGWATTFSDAPTALWLPAIAETTPPSGLPDGRFGFPVEWAPLGQVTVEACPDLAHPDWRPVGSLSLDANGTANFSDPDSASHPTRLYRVRSP